MVQITTEEVKTVKTVRKVKLTKQQIIGLLNDAIDYEVPNDAQVFIRVPGGGDWSNEDLDIEGSHGVEVLWEDFDPEEGS